jgi:hypothetical protein
MFEDDFLQYYTEGDYLYTEIVSTTSPLSKMQGYALWSVSGAATTELFSGTTNSASQSIAFTLTDFPDDSKEGWNLVGNPYPSVLDWDAVTIPAHLNGAIWLFDPTLGASGEYRYYISGGGAANTSTQYIPSGQGFFIRANGGSGSLAVDNTVRVHGGQNFYKESQANSGQMLVIEATGNNITTQTAIRFIPEATENIDRLYDVNKIIGSSEDVPIVYTKCKMQNMAINTYPTIAGHETIPLYFEAGIDGTYTFNAREMESINIDIPIYLEDISLNYFQNLRTNPEYSFEYTTAQLRNFNIHFKDATGIENIDNMDIQCFLANHVLQVNFQNNEFVNQSSPAIISIYNISGELLNTIQTGRLRNEIPFYASPSIYLVKITTERGVLTKKVFNR